MDSKSKPKLPSLTRNAVRQLDKRAPIGAPPDLTSGGSQSAIAQASASSAAPSFKPMTVQVHTLRRYLVDPKFWTTTGLPVSLTVESVYDMVISDGTHLRKVLCHPSLNDRIGRGEVADAAVITITGAYQHFDETDLDGSSIFIVTDLNYHGTAPGLLGPGKTATASNLDEIDDALQLKPLAGKRQYIEVYSNDLLKAGPGSHCTRADIHLEDAKVDKLTERAVTLGELHAQMKAGHVDTATHVSPVVCRVRRIGHVHIFNHAATDKRMFPYQGHLLVDDGTSMAVVVLWNAAVFDYIPNLCVGDVVVLSRFRAKPATSFSRGFWPDCPMELAVNDGVSHKAIRLLSAEAAQRFDNIPSVDSMLDTVPLSIISTRVDDETFDLAGIVTYCSRIERFQLAHGFEAYRWVQLVDGSGPDPITVRVGSCGHFEALSCLRPGQAIYVTACKLRSHTIDSLNRNVHLVTTPGSSFYLFDVSQLTQGSAPDQSGAAHAHDGGENTLLLDSEGRCHVKTLVTTPRIQSLIGIASDLEQEVPSFAQGGFCTMPISPVFQIEADKELRLPIPMAQVLEIADKLHLYEQVHVYVQGVGIALKWHVAGKKSYTVVLDGKKQFVTWAAAVDHGEDDGSDADVESEAPSQDLHPQTQPSQTGGDDEEEEDEQGRAVRRSKRKATKIATKASQSVKRAKSSTRPAQNSGRRKGRASSSASAAASQQKEGNDSTGRAVTVKTMSEHGFAVVLDPSLFQAYPDAAEIDQGVVDFFLPRRANEALQQTAVLQLSLTNLNKTASIRALLAPQFPDLHVAGQEPLDLKDWLESAFAQPFDFTSTSIKSRLQTICEQLSQRCLYGVCITRQSANSVEFVIDDIVAL